MMRIGKRLFSVLIAMAMIVGMLPAAAAAEDGNVPSVTAAQFTDMPNDWSTPALNNAVANGLLSGSGGKIMPYDNLTRAQMAIVIARAFGASVKGDISGFSDVKSSDWFADGFARAYQMGVINGSGGKMNPNSAITRQEVFVILARAFKLQPSDTVDKTFSDVHSISSWAAGEVYALVNAGYVQGSGGKLNPLGLITRAQFAQIFDNIVKQYISQAGVVTEVAAGNVMVNVPGVTLKDLKVSGDLIIGDGVGDGEVILDGVEVAGRMVVRGGGENSIIIKGSSNVSNVIVSRVDGKVSVKVEGDANVEVIYIDDGSDDVSIEGTVGNVDIQAPDIVVTAVGATIGSLDISGQNSTVVVDKNSKVQTVSVQSGATGAQVQVAGTVTNVTTAAAGTSVSGTGTVTKVEVQGGGNNAKIVTPSTQIVVGSGVTGVTGGGGTAISGGTTTNNNSSGTGTTTPTAPSGGNNNSDNDDDSTVDVNSITVAGADNATTIITAGGTLQMSAAVLPSNATNKAVTWSVTNGTGSATISTTGLLTAVKNGTVTVKASAKDGSGKYGEIVITISGQPTAIISTTSTIASGDEDPSIEVTLENDTFTEASTLPENWSFDSGDTGLSVYSIEMDTDIIVFELDGTASPGTLTLQAEAGALSGGEPSNTISITVPGETYAVTFGVTGSNGTLAATVDSIDIDSGDEVEAGKNVVFTATPSAGYQVKEWTVNEVVEAGNQTNTLMVTSLAEATAVTVEFEPAPEEPTEGTIDWDPGQTGGDVTIDVDGHTATFSGEIAYYEADESLGRTAGNRVGVKITAPAGMTNVRDTATLTIGETVYEPEDNWMDGDNYFYYYPLVTAADQSFTVIVRWDEDTEETYTIVIADATLEPAPEEPAEGTIEQDPGQTGGLAEISVDGHTATFSGEIAYYEADESLGRTAGNRVGVKITAPAGMTNVRDTATLTIGETVYEPEDNWMDGDNYFYYYPLVTAADQSFTVAVKWDGTAATAEEYTIRIAGDATLEPAPEEDTITLSPDEGSDSVRQGEALTEGSVTLSSNYNASGLTTIIGLSKDDAPVNFDTVFSSYTLSTTVGEVTSEEYEMNGEYPSFTYGPPSGYNIEAGVDQVTTVSGAVQATAPVGTYVITTEVKLLETGDVLASGTYTLIVEEAPTTDIPVAYYTGTDFKRSSEPIVESGGNVVQEINDDGSISITVKNTGSYIDSGFYLNAGILSELGDITVEGTGNYGLNLYFDLDNNGEFFEWEADGTTYAGTTGNDTYALCQGGPFDDETIITDASKFFLVGDGGVYTLSELKAKYLAMYPDTEIATGIWVGVTPPTGAEMSATISSVTITEALTPSIPVDYYTYTETDFKRSAAPIIEGNGKVTQTVGSDGSISITVQNTDGYIDSGFYLSAGTLSELGGITVEGTGDYGLNLYFDLDNNGEFFEWEADGTTYAGTTGNDRYALCQGPFDDETIINEATVFNLMGSGGGLKTLHELKALYPGDPPVGIWVGVTSPTGVETSATISSVTINAHQTIVYDSVGLIQAVTAAEEGDTIYLANGTFELAEQLNINKSLTLEGIGEVTLKAVPPSGTEWSDVNGYKHLLSIYAGDEEHPVTITNITLDSDGKAYGVHAYPYNDKTVPSYVVLNDVTIKNSLGAGLTVNGSTVRANNLNTSGNTSGAVNVDPGVGVTTPSVFNLTFDGAVGVLAEDTQIWSDGANVNPSTGPAVNVTIDPAGGYTEYSSGAVKAWTNRPVTIGSVTYPTLRFALTMAANSDTISLSGDAEFSERLVTDKSVTINGNGHTLSFTDAVNAATYGTRHGICIDADNVTLDDLTVEMAAASGWQGVYGIQVYASEGVVLNNVTASGGDRGIYANASEVTLTGTIDVSGNEFGGIEVGKGSGASLSNASLTVSETLVNSSESCGIPTIVLVHNADPGKTPQGTVTGTDVPGYINYYSGDEYQTHYYLSEAFLPVQLVSVTSNIDAVNSGSDESFALTVKADIHEGLTLRELEIDHNLGDPWPEFSVYAVEGDGAYGTDEDKVQFNDLGVHVTYSAEDQEWTIDFGDTATEAFIAKGTVRFYLVIKDTSEAAYHFGTMYGTTEENTFEYTFTSGAE